MEHDLVTRRKRVTKRFNANVSLMKIRKLHLLLFLLFLSIFAYFFRSDLYDYYDLLVRKIKDKQYEIKIMDEFENAFGNGYRQEFLKFGVSYPPKKVLLVGIKQTHSLEFWAQGKQGQIKHIFTSEKFLSGKFISRFILPPEKVPEGVFSMVTLKSPHVHLLILQNLPNDQKKRLKHFFKLLLDVCFDVDYCISSPAVLKHELDMPEIGIDLFIYKIGVENMLFIISPVDFRKEVSQELIDSHPEWSSERYLSIRRELNKLK